MKNEIESADGFIRQRGISNVLIWHLSPVHPVTVIDLLSVCVHLVCPQGRVCVRPPLQFILGRMKAPSLWEIFSDRLLESTKFCIFCFYAS